MMHGNYFVHKFQIFMYNYTAIRHIYIYFIIDLQTRITSSYKNLSSQLANVENFEVWLIH